MANTTINRCNYYYDISGEGTEPLFFAHGLLLTSAFYHNQIEFFQSRYKTILFDERGHGKTEFAEGGYDLDSLTNDVIKLIEFIDVGPVHFVGHSMGGFIGMRIAARRPDLVKSLILFNTSAEADAHILRYKLLKLATQLFGVKSVARPVRSMIFGKQFLRDPHKKEESDFWLNLLSNLPKSILQISDQIAYRPGVESELKNIACPTLIVGGKEDRTLSAKNSELLNKHIAHSTLKIFDGVGHCAPIEVPDQVNQLMDDFLTKQD